MAMRTRGWRLLATGTPLLLLVAAGVLLSLLRQPVGTAPVTALPAPLWRTATARVQSARGLAQPTPVTRAAQLTAGASESATPTPPSVIGAAPAASTGATAAPPASASVMQATPSPPARPATAPLVGSALLERSFYSDALGRAMPYFIYLPAGYAESGTRYPVIYMLHGYGGSNTEWVGYGFPETADTMIAAGEIPPVIIVLPQGDQSYWVNHADDGERWGDYTAEDVVRQIDTNYRTIPDAQHRAIGGLSMGGQAALQLALNYPGVFGVVGMHSPTLRDYQSAQDLFGFWGDEAYFDAHDPSHLVQDYPDRARDLKIEIDVGAQDADWRGRTEAFASLLAQLSIPYQWNLWPGEHDGTYWGAHSRDYLRFYAAALGGH